MDRRVNGDQAKVALFVHRGHIVFILLNPRALGAVGKNHLKKLTCVLQDI